MFRKVAAVSENSCHVDQWDATSLSFHFSRIPRIPPIFCLQSFHVSESKRRSWICLTLGSVGSVGSVGLQGEIQRTHWSVYCSYVRCFRHQHQSIVQLWAQNVNTNGLHGLHLGFCVAMLELIRSLSTQRYSDIPAWPELEGSGSMSCHVMLCSFGRV